MSETQKQLQRIEDEIFRCKRTMEHSVSYLCALTVVVSGFFFGVAAVGIWLIFRDFSG